MRRGPFPLRARSRSLKAWRPGALHAALYLKRKCSRGALNGMIFGWAKLTEPAKGVWKAANRGVAETCLPYHPNPGPTTA